MENDTDNAEERISRMERIIEQLQKEAVSQKQVNARVIKVIEAELVDEPTTPVKP